MRMVNKVSSVGNFWRVLGGEIPRTQNRHRAVVEMRDFKLMEFAALSAILMLIVLPSVACAAMRAEQDRSVLAAALSGTCKYMSRKGEKGFEVLDSKSTDVNQITDSQPNLPDAFMQALRNLLKRNSSPETLPSGIACSHIKVVRHERIQEFFLFHEASEWREFYATFPGAGGLIGISLPGYSKDKKHAVVLRAGSCGDLCGAGFLVLLRKYGDTWKVVKSVGLWIS